LLLGLLWLGLTKPRYLCRLFRSMGGRNGSLSFFVASAARSAVNS
jgi:hypothetical protein